MGKQKLLSYLLYSLFALGLMVIFYFWFKQSASATLFTSLGRIGALLAVYLILTQLLLIGRVYWIERVIGHDKLSRIHRINGFLAWVFIIAHPPFITLGYALSSNSTFIHQFTNFLSFYEDIPSATIAFAIFIISIGFSLKLMRKKMKYELWLLVHIMMYAAVLLAFGHQLELGGDFSNNTFVGFWYFIYLFSFGNLIFFRFGLPLYNFYRQDYTIEKVTKESDSAVSIDIRAKNLYQLDLKPGQFMIFRFLQKGFWYEAHPFSISKINKNNFRITIKSLGDFTTKIKHLSVGTKIIAEGPYGRFTLDSASKRKFLLIAGGVGITPMKPLIEELSSKGKEVTLVYSARNKKDLLFEKELKSIANRKNVKVIYVITEKGNRVTPEFIAKEFSDILEREIYICGPKGMIHSLLNSLIKQKVKKENIHYELFSMG